MMSTHPSLVMIGVASAVFALLGLVAFNLGYVWLYIAFLPLLCISSILSVEVHVDLFLALLLLAVASTLVYSIGIFALPLVACGVGASLPLIFLLKKWHILPPSKKSEQYCHFWGRRLELCELLLISLLARYVLYRAGGGTIPIQIGELESLSRFLISEVGGWSLFALGYGMQLRIHYGTLYAAETDFVTSLPSLLAMGLFLVSPHVAIMTLGLNFFGVTGLYVGSLPVGAAHILMRTLTWRRLEMEQQNQRLQQMNIELARSERLAAMGQMSSAISHQLLQKVGLVGLQSALLRDVLLDDAMSPASRLQEGRERVEQLDESIADLNTTLSDLLIFSKDVALHVNPYPLESLVREVTNEVRTMAAARGVSVIYRSDGEEILIPIDKIKIKQALMNLLTNAVEASPANGQVCLTLQREGQSIRISVRDFGEGIPESDQERIFSPFFSTKTRGTGLGLTFAQKIVALHGGAILVDNNLQRGAIFVIELPYPDTPQV